MYKFSKEPREFLELIKQDGWELAGMSKSTHIRVVHPETGEKANVSLSPRNNTTRMNERRRLRRRVAIARQQLAEGKTPRKEAKKSM